MAEKYEELANSLIGLLGGTDNITYFTHCVTRLRFNVKDKGLVDQKAIDNIKGVVGSQWQGEQYQVIIGQSVGDAYELILKKTGMKREDAIDENLDADGAKPKFSIGAVFDAFAGCMTPLIPALVGGGLLKVLVILLEQFGLMTAESPTAITMTFVGDAVFYFLPVMIGYTGAKKFGANPALGMLLGGALIHPTFVSMVSEGSGGSVFGLPIYAGSYSSSVFPMILTTYVLSKVERFIGKHSPDAIRSITEPLLTLVVMMPVMLCALAPLGSWIGVYFAKAVMAIYSVGGFVGVAILAAVFPYVVMTGMHTAFTPYLLNSFAAVGYDPIVCTANFISNFCQGAACAAISLKTKNANLKSTAASCAITAIVGGVTEPAMFGVTLKVKRGMYGAMIGGLTGGLIAGLLKCAVYAFPGNGGMFGLVCFLNTEGSGLVEMIIAEVVACVVTFIATYIIYKDEDETATATEEE